MDVVLYGVVISNFNSWHFWDGEIFIYQIHYKPYKSPIINFRIIGHVGNDFKKQVDAFVAPRGAVYYAKNRSWIPLADKKLLTDF